MPISRAPTRISSHRTAGVRPAVSAAIESAANATSSPCGMKMMRVTENTSTMASAVVRVENGTWNYTP